jgi:hypothetical protein
MAINIPSLKRQLNIEQSFSNDDAILQQCLDVAVQTTYMYLGNNINISGFYPSGNNVTTGYTGTTVPISIEHAILMLASHFYVNRNIVAFATPSELPYSYKFLLDWYKDFIIK